MASGISSASESPEAFFDALFGEHWQAVHAYFLGRIGDSEAALDLLSETFLRVWRQLSTLQTLPPDQRRYWIFGVAKNLLTDHYRSRAARNRLDEELLKQPEQILSPSVDPEASHSLEEDLSCLEAALLTLPDELRTVLVMSVLGEMTGAEIAAALGKPAGTVRYRIHQARKRLADALKLQEAHPQERITA